MAVTSPDLRESDLAYYGPEAERLAEDLRGITGWHELDRLRHVPDTLPRLQAIAESRKRNFPNPRALWSMSKFDGAQEWDCLRYLAPIEGKRVAQVGGSGAWAVEFALAGAREAWLVSPFQSELEAGREIARLAGVELHCRLCPAERLRFKDGYFDAIFAPGSAHHFDTDVAFPEIRRVLHPGGKFAAFEPWLTPIYKIGIRVFGKREPGVKCIPLDPGRLVSFYRAFPEAQVRHHGAFTRYGLILLGRFVRLPDSFVWSVLSLDDAITLPVFRQRLGSGVALLAQHRDTEALRFS
jgi:SAM-dependent methyltransferase